MKFDNYFKNLYPSWAVITRSINTPIYYLTISIWRQNRGWRMIWTRRSAER